MGWCFALPLAALACFLLPAGCCVTCVPSVMAAVKSLEKDYLPGHLEAKQHEKVMDMVHNTLKDFQDQPFIQGSYVGIIDKSSLEEVAQNLLKELKRITDSSVKGEEFVTELNSTLIKEKEDFAQHAGHFQKEAYCPNKCGVMFQSLIWCQHCDKKVHTCRKPINCGEHHVETHESEDMILDCLLDWHRISEGLTDYKFYRVWANHSETLLYKGKEPVLTKQGVTEADEGKYRCELDTVMSGPSTIISYHVTVLPPNIHEAKHAEHLEREHEETSFDVHSESPTSESAVSARLEPITSLQPSQAQSMLQGRLFGLLICFFILLVAALLLRLIYWRKSKEKSQSSQLSSRKTSSKQLSSRRTSKKPSFQNTSSKTSKTMTSK
ncbi:izumo sperm-egg fusion protein 1-like [Sciurus carolinensis]|uniref:izumo sperm-egg fusion protein 1-like n=1 Tax=Sciurus carolinensis TaxID=30640 RepID=UPI001FB4F2AE|nr:izumo sperm-egg fusion protein 1-like [Sciurus carolinensis]